MHGLIGWVDGRPVYRLAGADGIDFLFEDDDGADDTDDGSGDGDDDTTYIPKGGNAQRRQDDTDADDWKPPSREEWEKLRRTAKTATAQAVQRKRLLREQGINPRTGRPFSAGEAVEALAQSDDRSEALAAAREDAQRDTRYRSALATAELKARLTGAGWVGNDLKLVRRLIDMDAIDVEVSDDGDVAIEGLDEQIERIRAEVPGWFRRRRTSAGRSGGGDDGATGAAEVDGGDTGRPAARRQKSWKDALGSQFDGTSRRR